MIFFMAGTSDARELALAIQATGYPILASVVTEHAANNLRESGLKARFGRLDESAMLELFQEVGVTLLVDASHPFAEEAHRTAMKAAASQGIPYIRFEREHQNFADHPLISYVETYEQAAILAAQKKGSVMLTTGSKTLQIFTEQLGGQAGVRLVARMLPRADNMEKCAALGVGQQDIIAMQGPFSRSLNEALYQHYGTTVMVTKESGGPGAVDEKVEAALGMGIEVIIIGRPNINFSSRLSSIDDVIAEIGRRMQA